MLPISGAHRRHGEPNAREIDPLTAADRAPLNDATADKRCIPLADHQADGAIREHHRITHGKLVHEWLVGDRELTWPMAFGAPHERDMLSLDEIDGTTGQFAEPDLGTGKIGEGPDGAGKFLRDPADAGQRLGMLLDGAVGHVEPKDIDPSLDETADGLLTTGGGTKRGHNLGPDDFGQGRAEWIHGGHPSEDGHEAQAGPDGTIRQTRCGMWKGRRVIVAGGTAGFGLVLGCHLARAGARVLLVGRSEEGVRRALAVAGSGGDMHGITADLSQPGEGRRTADEAVRILGGIDDLFFCVGRSGRAAILRTDRQTLEDYLSANLLAAVEITQAVADDVAAARGHIVYVGSLAGKVVTPFMGPYAVAKSALAAYADAVRLEQEPRGGHVLLVSPGPIARSPDDPTADRAEGRYAKETAAAGLPNEAASPGGTRSLPPLDPNRLAMSVLDACRRGTSELVVPRKVGLLAGLIEWFPDWGRRLLARHSRPRP